MKTAISPAGVWSAIGSLGLMLAIALYTNVFGAVFADLGLLFSGGALQIVPNNTTFLVMFSVIIAVVVLELGATIGAAIFQGLILGKTGKHALEELFGKLGHGHHFFIFFVVVTAEELVARWLFLGVLTQIPFLSGTVGFYSFFFLGNAIWALFHLTNFTEDKDRHPLRVLPQFVAGIFFTYIYLKYGLLASILAHFASNAIIFSIHKIQRVNFIDFLFVCYSALVAGVSYVLMSKPVADIVPWFTNGQPFALEGWGFWDYFLLAMFTGSVASLVFDLLLYDSPNMDVGKKKENPPFGYTLFVILLGGMVVVGIMYGLFWLMGLFITDVPYRILILGILLAFVHKGSSGSAMSRVFWGSIPSLYVSMCVMQALGFWYASAYIVLSSIIFWTRYQLQEYND